MRPKYLFLSASTILNSTFTCLALVLSLVAQEVQPPSVRLKDNRIDPSPQVITTDRPVNQADSPSFEKGDIVSLIAALSKGSGRKSEFETTAQYEERRALHTFTGKGYILIFDGAYFDYDADTQVMRARLVASKLKAEEGGEYTSLTLYRHEKKDTYTASNAFGAVREVSRSSVVEFGIATPQMLPIESLYLPMAIPDAQTLKPHLRLAVTCVLRNDKTVHYKSATTATLDLPEEYSWAEEFVQAELKQLIIFDGRDGTPLLTVNPYSDTELRSNDE